MEEAKSMYQGGIIVSANDPELDYNSYKRQGLRCIYCGEPVALNKGLINKPYFDHFKAKSHLDYECPGRVGFDNNLGYYLHYQARGQRKVLFEKYLLDIISESYPDFTSKVSWMEEHLELEELIKKISKMVKKNQGLIAKSIKNKSGLDSKIPLINYLIAVEVLDYLCCNATDYLFNKVLMGIIYFQYNLNHLDLSKVKNVNISIAEDDVSSNIQDFLLSINWLTTIKNIIKKNRLNQQLNFIKKEVHQELKDKIDVFLKKAIYSRESELKNIKHIKLKLRIMGQSIYVENRTVPIASIKEIYENDHGILTIEWIFLKVNIANIDDILFYNNLGDVINNMLIRRLEKSNINLDKSLIIWKDAEDIEEKLKHEKQKFNIESFCLQYISHLLERHNYGNNDIYCSIFLKEKLIYLEVRTFFGLIGDGKYLIMEIQNIILTKTNIIVEIIIKRTADIEYLDKKLSIKKLSIREIKDLIAKILNHNYYQIKYLN